MKKNQFVKDIGPNDEVCGLFLLGAASLLQARNGPFWRLELKDCSGTLEAKIWSPQSQEYPNLAAGYFVELQGRAGLFRDQLQVSVDRLRLLSEQESSLCDLALFLPASARPAQEMLDEAERLCRCELGFGPWKKFALAVLKDPEIRALLLLAPAAKSVHHAYLGGLLEHMLSVTGLCLDLAGHYPELDRQILLTAALFHDIGKLWELDSGLTTEYSDEGKLLGHIFLGLERLEPFLQKSGLPPELVRHFKHLVLSHHGEYHFGSPQLPQTPEAFILHHADNIDAKMAQCRSLFAALPEGQNWSAYQNTLGRAMHLPDRSPEQSEAKAPKPRKENQCLSLLKE